MHNLFNILKNTELEPLILACHSYYGQNAVDRKYHNLYHAHTVVRNLHALTNNTTTPSLVLAGLWHDAVYFPGVGTNANEMCSARAFEIEFDRYVTDPAYNQIKRDTRLLIKRTTIDDHLSCNAIQGDEAYLLDADLGSLAAPWDEFINTQGNIILENSGQIPRDYKKGAEFLKMFLWKRDFIYHTAEARELWEYNARLNITKYCKDYDVSL